MRISLVAALLALASSLPAATRNAATMSFSEVNNAVNGVGNMSSGTRYSTPVAQGDTVVMPAGTAIWNQTLTISRNITLIGAGQGVSVIIDQTPKAAAGKNQVIRVNMDSATALMRLSGFTINGSKDGPTGAKVDTGGVGAITVSGHSTIPNLRIDHVDVNEVYGRPGEIWNCLGVVDHCNFTMGPWTGGIEVQHSSWKGVGANGDNSWADDSHWGTEQFLFFEQCTFTNFQSATFCDVSSGGGMRVVVRHCVINWSMMGGHGTETSQRARGSRAVEFYRNTVDGGDSTKIHDRAIYIRSGTELIHHNTFTRYSQLAVLANYRMWFKATPWGYADGANVWDSNDPNIYASGTAGTGIAATLAVPSATWTSNQWKGYSIRNLTKRTASEIASNTATVITPQSNPQGASMTFATGDSWEIRKVNVVLDQPGRGKGSYIQGNPPTPIGYVNNVLEPVRIWNNQLLTTPSPGFGNGNGRSVVASQNGNIRAGTDWIYSRYQDDSAALAGYTEFTYPHPLSLSRNTRADR